MRASAATSGSAHGAQANTGIVGIPQVWHVRRWTHHGSEFRLEHLERDLPLVLEVVGQVDGRHTALTDLALDAVAALEGGVQAGDWICTAHGA